MLGLFKRSRHQGTSKPKFRLNVESLEERWNPANFNVTNLDDAGAGSLRAAITGANNAGGVITHTIVFVGPNAQEGTITLASEVAINANVKITGPGADKVEVRGNDAQEDPFRVFTIKEDKGVRIEHLTMAGGGTTSADPNGGVIKVETGGKLTLRQCVVKYGGALGDGGGIWVGTAGQLTLEGTTIDLNFAKGNGGGIAVASGDRVEIAGAFSGGQWQRTIISNNSALKNGGGAWLTGAGNANQVKFTISKTNVIDNSSEGGNGVGANGGGIYLEWNGNPTVKPVNISETEITRNQAIVGYGGGIYLKADTEFGGGVKIHESMSGQKDGIGIYVFDFTKTKGVDGLDVKGNRYLPPGGMPPPPGGGEGGEPIPLNPEDDPLYLPSAIYIGTGAEFVLSGAMIYANHGVGVRGAVISLGYNYAENSLETSSGWIETDIVT